MHKTAMEVTWIWCEDIRMARNKMASPILILEIKSSTVGHKVTWNFDARSTIITWNQDCETEDLMIHSLQFCSKNGEQMLGYSNLLYIFLIIYLKVSAIGSIISTLWSTVIWSYYYMFCVYGLGNTCSCRLIHPF